jgi:hypothetical protein
MEIREERLAFADLGPFGRDWLFHLEDQIASAPDRSGIGSDLRADVRVELIGEATALARPALDPHRMPRRDQRLGPRGHERDAILVRFDFFRYADVHGKS